MENQRRSEEMKVQKEVFNRCCADALLLIARHAETFRDIINRFEHVHDRVPTADEIIWLTSELVDHDITKET